MDLSEIRGILEAVSTGGQSADSAMEKLRWLAGSNLGYASIDYHRALRNGFPEVIYCPGKSHAHIAGIVGDMLEKSEANILLSRADSAVYETVRAVAPQAVYHELARTIVVERKPFEKSKGHVLVVTAGTADIPVAEEAAVTSTVLGNDTRRIYDVGVAGIHRLFNRLDEMREASVLIVVAGMEGALPSVVGGLVDMPVIAVPTSVGYGSAFGGVSALLGMLNSCASGLAVMNIDNGFGAACHANRIMRLLEGKRQDRSE